MSDERKLHQPRYLLSRAMVATSFLLKGANWVLFWIMVAVSSSRRWLDKSASEIFPSSETYLNMKDDDEQG